MAQKECNKFIIIMTLLRVGKEKRRVKGKKRKEKGRKKTVTTGNRPGRFAPQNVCT